MEREFTASTYILHQQKILLIFHPKFLKWLPPGGHVEKNETPAEAAKREVKEETGLDIDFIKQENLWINRWNVKSIERPYFCMLGHVPPYKERAAHQHIDFVYIAQPSPNTPMDIPENCRWFTLEDLKQLKPDEDVFQESLEIIQHLEPLIQLLSLNTPPAV